MILLFLTTAMIIGVVYYIKKGYFQCMAVELNNYVLFFLSLSYAAGPMLVFGLQVRNNTWWNK